MNDDELAEDTKTLATEEGDHSFNELTLEGSNKSRLFSSLLSPVWCITDWCWASCVLHLEFLATSACAPSGSWWKWTTSLSSAGAAPRRTLRLGTCSIRYHYIGMCWPLEMVWSLILYFLGKEGSTSFGHVCMGKICIYTGPTRVNEIHPRILCTRSITKLPEEESTIIT